jgi:uncharacterized protein (TIGR02231 family)
VNPAQTTAPIVAVTVYPDCARVTRRAVVSRPPGQHRLRIGPLPLGLNRDSLRVAGRGRASVLGVDVLTEHQPGSTDATVAELTRQRRALSDELAELADADAVETQRGEFLAQLAQRAGGTYARALAAGQAAPADVAAFADSLADQIAATRARQREVGRRREGARDRLAAIDRQLEALSGKRQPDRLFAEVTVEIPADAEIHQGDAEIQLDLSYVVPGAAWQPSYDLRLAGEALTLTWFAAVSQRTGEDWPECELLLSTARPSRTATIPELDPWYLDRVRPLLPARSPMAFGGSPGEFTGPALPAAVPPPASAAPAGRAGSRSAAEEAAPLLERVATVEQGVAAATYRPARPVAVPADGDSYRATVAVLEFSAALDYVTAPVRAAEAHLRATVVNTSAHTLLPGPAAVFHGGDFVGGTQLSSWAPGERIELALGLDDRVRVERKLVRRGATKAALGSTRRREVEHRITVANHTPGTARVTVLDQLPVSRDEAITVREPRLEPAPVERSDLGELTWRLELAPGESREIVTGVRVELAKGVELAGWRE